MPEEKICLPNEHDLREEDRIYQLHGMVSGLVKTVDALDGRLTDHIVWAEKLVMDAKNDEKDILRRMGLFERRVDKIEWKVGIIVAGLTFALNHTGWVIENLEQVAYAVTAVVHAMGN